MYLKSNVETTSKPLSIFFSYSHRDQVLRDRLEESLSFLKRAGEIVTWHDRIIRPGDDWKNRIDENLNKADIILLLISPSFGDSNYCYDIEMKRALERHENGEATVVPVILRPSSNWQKTPFGRLQALPRDGRAVTSDSWKDLDEAFKTVADGISLILQDFQKKSFFSVDLPKWTLMVDGDFSDFSDDKIQDVTQRLFRLTADVRLSFVEKSAGSVCLKFQSTRQALIKIQKAHEDKLLDDYLCLSIKRISEDVGALVRIETKIVNNEVKAFSRYLPEVFGGRAMEEGWAPLVTGMAIPCDNPIHPGFSIGYDASQNKPSENEILELQTRLGRYLNTFLVVEGELLHVTLSPLDEFGGLTKPLRHTELGRDLLSQDVVLKHFTAQLLHPDSNSGKSFWNRIEKSGVDLNAVSLDSCIRVWIVPGKVSLKENNQDDVFFHVDIEKFNLQVLCESDYTTIDRFAENSKSDLPAAPTKFHEQVIETFKELILPKIFNEVNRGNRFSILRQIFTVGIFSAWFEKSNLGPSLIKCGFMNSNDVEKYRLNTAGDEAIQLKEQYSQMFNEGVWRHTQTFYDIKSKEIKRRVYVVGGIFL